MTRAGEHKPLHRAGMVQRSLSNLDHYGLIDDVTLWVQPSSQRL